MGQRRTAPNKSPRRKPGDRAAAHRPHKSPRRKPGDRASVHRAPNKSPRRKPGDRASPDKRSRRLRSGLLWIPRPILALYDIFNHRLDCTMIVKPPHTPALRPPPLSPLHAVR
jgi:hypothetical protein